MKLLSILPVLVAFLILAGHARAETIHTRLTLGKTSDHLYAFTIKVERLKDREAGEFVEFQVKAKNVGGVVAEHHRSGELAVYSGKELLSTCYVQPTGIGGERSFTFRVSAKLAEKSRFTFAETPDPPAANDRGGFYYWFYLQDFVEPK